MTNLKSAGVKEFTLLVKGDVQGSVEAIVAALDKLGTDEVRARIVHAGVGGITESDVGLAATSGAAILGFNVRANAQAREAAERDGVEIRYYAVIYDLVDEVKQAMSGLLAPTRKETFLGNAEILEVFTISKVGKVAGCRVTEGKVERGAQVRLIRDNVVVHEGKLSTLEALQGRGARGDRRPGMRHGVRGLPGHAPGRCHRVLRGRARPAHALVSMARSKPAAAKAPSQRQLKVGETIRHALADIFFRGDIVDEVLSQYSLTVPEVRMTPDLKLATAFIFPLGGGRAPTRRSSISTSTSAILRGELAKRVRLKFMPEIRFKVDTSFESSRRIDELLASPKVARDLDD